MIIEKLYEKINYTSFLTESNIDYKKIINILYILLIIIFFIIIYICLIYLNYKKTLIEKVIQIKEYREEKNKNKLEKYILDKNDIKYYIENNIILTLIKKSEKKEKILNDIKLNKIYKINYYGKQKYKLTNIQLID